MWIITAVIILLLLISGGLISMLKITVPIANNVYFDKLVRTSPDKWGRECSAPDNEEQLAMWELGVKWGEENKEYIKELHIQNDGLNLYGEMFDYGSDRCVIILPGRCESLMYSYFFAAPYKKAGMNVLCIDTRCHGKSDGKYNTVGVKESEDLKAWIDYITGELGIKEVYLHGICVGSSAALFLLENKDCPEEVKGMVTEGCFTTFRETFKQHMIVDKRPLFPVLDLIMWNIRKHTGVNVLKKAPVNSVKKINKKILFLFGKKDVFSIPPKSQKLFDACASKEKEIVWFEEGTHSHLRLANPEKYDSEVISFVNGK